MERKGVVLCSIVVLLGVVSAATGFAAEVTRIKASDVKLVSTTECSYPQSPALYLGLTAAATLLLAKIIINYATGCFCCRRTPQTGNSNRTKALVFYVISSITFVIAFFLLLKASALNDQHGEASTNYGIGNYYCYVVKPGVFAGGASLAALSVIFGIFYYVTLNTGNAPLPNPNQGGIVTGIAMGQPQFPLHSSQPPAFAYEDTYNKRQFT